MVDWTAVEAGEVDEDGRYVRLINNTTKDVTANLTKFEVASNFSVTIAHLLLLLE